MSFCAPGSLTGISPTLLQQYLSDAQLALHRLQIGQAIVKVRISDGSETEFKPAEINELRGYVKQLQDELNGRQRVHGAFNVVF